MLKWGGKRNGSCRKDVIEGQVHSRMLTAYGFVLVYFFLLALRSPTIVGDVSSKRFVFQP